MRNICLVFIGLFFNNQILDAAPNAPAIFSTTNLTRAQMASHLLNRMAFGPRLGQIEELLAKPSGLENWFESQLNPEKIEDTALEQKLLVLKVPRMSTEAVLEKYKRPIEIFKAAHKGEKIAEGKDFNPEAKSKIRAEHPEILPANILFELSLQKIIRAVESRREFQEVIADFWFNHFNVHAHKGRLQWYLPSYERDAIRSHLFGKFRDLLHATAHHPAMLMYLDNWQSVRDGFEAPKSMKQFLKEEKVAKIPQGINENYARELMELHTLGVDGGYTQADIIQLARALTGWTIERPNRSGTFLFRAAAHDDRDVTILGKVFSGKSGQKQGEAILDFLAAQPATAKFLAQKLCNRFVREPAPATCIEHVAKAYLGHDGDLREVYRALFTSADFWDQSSLQQKVKKPFDFLMSSLRAIGANIEANQDFQDMSITRAMQGLGEPLYGCGPPTGYKDEAAAWVNTGALVSRMRTATALAGGRWDTVHWDISRLFPSANGDFALDMAAEKILGRKLQPQSKKTMEKVLTGNELGIQDRELRNGERIRLIALLLGSPDFQRR